MLRMYYYLGYSEAVIGNCIKCIILCKKAIDLSKEVKDKYLNGRANHSLGMCYWFLSNFNGAMLRFKISFEQGFMCETVYKYSLGQINIKLGLLKNALNDFRACLELSQKEQDKMSSSSSLTGIGFINAVLGNYNQAEKYLNEAKNIQEKFNFKRNLVWTNHCIGILNHMKGQLDKAKKNYEDALISASVDYDIAFVKHQLGTLYEDTGELYMAEEYYNSSLKIFNKIKSAYGKAKTLHHIGLIYELKGDKSEDNKTKEEYYQKAEKYYLKSLELKEDLTKENRELLNEEIKKDSKLKELLQDILKDFEVKSEDKLGKAVTLGQLGILKIKTKDYDEAEKCLTNANKLFKDIFLELLNELGVKREINIYLKTADECLTILNELKSEEITHKKALKKLEGLKFRDFLIQ